MGRKCVSFSKCCRAVVLVEMFVLVMGSLCFAQEKKPDLVIKAFGLKEWGKCEPGHAVFTFHVTVANIGTAPSPSVTDFALVQAMDQHSGINWGNSVVISESIPPGGNKTVLIPVYYLMANPTHMTGAPPHPFKAIADPGKRVTELNEGNNESRVIDVGAPQGCPKK